MELPSAESNRAQILRRSFRREIPIRNRVRCRDSACAGVDLSENDRFPGRPYHHLPAEKLNRVQPKSLLYQLSYVGALPPAAINLLEWKRFDAFDNGDRIAMLPFRRAS